MPCAQLTTDTVIQNSAQDRCLFIAKGIKHLPEMSNHKHNYINKRKVWSTTACQMANHAAVLVWLNSVIENQKSVR